MLETRKVWTESIMDKDTAFNWGETETVCTVTFSVVDSLLSVAYDIRDAQSTVRKYAKGQAWVLSAAPEDVQDAYRDLKEAYASLDIVAVLFGVSWNKLETAVLQLSRAYDRYARPAGAVLSDRRLRDLLVYYLRDASKDRF